MLRNIVRTSLILVLVWLGGCTRMGGRRTVTTLTGITNPYHFMWVDASQLYVADGTGPEGKRTTVHVYSLPKVKHLFSFGEEGEGSGRFLVQPAHSVHLNTGFENLIINSGGKVSLYTREGELIRELEHERDSYFYQPFGDGFVGRQIFTENGGSYYRLNLYDSGLNFLSEITRKKDPGWAFSGDFYFQVYGDQLFVTGVEDDLMLYIYNGEGEKILDIRHQYDRIPVLKAQREEHFEGLLNRPGWEEYFDNLEEYQRYLQQRIKYPKLFPAVMEMIVADDRIYMVTYDQRDGLREVLVLDLRGSLLGREMVPFAMKSELEFYPFTIGNSRIYQLLPGEEAGVWDLHTTCIR